MSLTIGISVVTLFIFLCILIIIRLWHSNYHWENLNSFFVKKADPHTSTLLLIPHQDDDLLMAGAVIRSAIIRQETIRVVFATNGDCADDPSKRISEAISALSLFGLKKDNVIFLGYGDQWDTEYNHIYHAPSDTVVTSKSGKTKTYAAAGVIDFSTAKTGLPREYTRENYKTDLRTLLLDYRPDKLYVIDLDSHVDHRALSLLFEEVMGEILKSDVGYFPRIYKGFSYGTVWNAYYDFYHMNLRSTEIPDPSMLCNTISPLDNPDYEWDKRVRHIVPGELLSYTLRSSLLYKAMKLHRSQKILLRRAPRAINSDNVFWERRTDSLSYHALISSTSGDPSHVNTFKCIDSSNIKHKAFIFTPKMWVPDNADPRKTLRYDLLKPSDISSVVLYQGLDANNRIISGKLLFSDDSTLDIDFSKDTGFVKTVEFNTKRNLTYIEFSIITSTGDMAGIREFEIFPPIQPKVSYIKLILESDHLEDTGMFLYRYVMPYTNTMRFSFYSYPHNLISEKDITLTLTSRSGKRLDIQDRIIRLPRSFVPKSYCLTATLRDDPTIYDKVELVSNHFVYTAYIKSLQFTEYLYDKSKHIIKRLLLQS